MDSNTKFLIKRMDQLESRIMMELKELQAWKNRAMGIIMVAGAVTSVIISFAVKHL